MFLEERFLRAFESVRGCGRILLRGEAGRPRASTRARAEPSFPPTRHRALP